MVAKKAAGKQPAHAVHEQYAARGEALARLQAADNDWWDGIEVTVPWAAVSAAHAARDDTWVGIITDAVENSNPLNSQFTIEDPEFEDEYVISCLCIHSYATCAPLNPALSVDEMVFELTDYAVKALISSKETLTHDQLTAAAAQTKIPLVELVKSNDTTGLFTFLPPPKHQHELKKISAHDEKLVLHTSGTTSKPKTIGSTKASLCKWSSCNFRLL